MSDSGVISHISQNNNLYGWGLSCGKACRYGVFVAGKVYMGRKDIVDRPYFSDCQRFAELVNAALYRGKDVLQPGNLTPVRRKYPSLSSSCGNWSGIS